MTTAVNERDVIIESAAARTYAGLYATVLLRADTQTFHVDVNGNPTPSTINLYASLVNLDGTVTFSASGATITGVTPKAGTSETDATLTFANMTGPTAVVTASVTYSGQTFTSSVIISKVTDGTSGGNGTPGARGAGHFYISGTSWSDTAASAACPGGPVANDVVTVSDGSTYVLDKIWSGTQWVAMGTVIDGNLIVTRSIRAAALNVLSLNAITATIGTFQTATTGSRLLIKDALLACYDSGNVARATFGDSSLA